MIRIGHEGLTSSKPGTGQRVLQSLKRSPLSSNVVLRRLYVPSGWGKKRIFNRKDKRARSLEEIPTKGKELNSRVVVFARNEERIYTDDKVESLVSNDRLNKTVNNFNVNEITTSSTRAFDHRLTGLKGNNLEPSLTKITSKIPSSASYLEDARASRQLQRADQSASKWGDMIPEILVDTSLKELRGHRTKVLSVLE
jgi:hypothetical protein